MKLYKKILRHPNVENFLVGFGVLILRLFKLTIPFERVNFDEAERRTASGKGNIYAFWHGRMLMMPFAYNGKNIHVLISFHSDGSLISNIMARLGIHSVRGSSSRGASSALKKMCRLMSDGKDIAFTPDGPRGPFENAHMGVITAAKLGGAPVFPVTYSTSRRKILKSWDRFLLPFPFSRGVYICGSPVAVPRDADEVLMEEKRKELQIKLIEIGEDANSYYKN